MFNLDNCILSTLCLYFLARAIQNFFLKKRICISVFIYSLYLIIGIFSILLINHPDANYRHHLSIWPFIYFVIFFELTAYPVNYFSKKIINISPPNNAVFELVALFSIIISLLCLPSIINGFKTGIAGILTDNNVFNDIYQGKHSGSADVNSSNYISALQGVVGYFSILMFFYYMTLPYKKRWIVYGLLFSILTLPSRYIAGSDRTGLVACLFSMIGAYLLFNDFYSDKIKRIVKIVLSISLCLIIAVIVAITISRFSNRDLFYFVYLYLGQPLLNYNFYCLDAGGTRNGDRVFTLLKDIIDPDAALNYDERLVKYRYLEIDESYFTTYIGDIVLDFGALVSIILAVAIFLFLRSILKSNSKILPFHNCIIVFTVLCMITEGWTLYRYGDKGGNIRLLGFILLYFLFRFIPPSKTLSHHA